MATHTTICLGFRLYQTFLANCLIFSFDLSLMIINSPPALSPGKLWHHCSLKLNTDINGKKLTQDDKVTDLSCFCKKNLPLAIVWEGPRTQNLFSMLNMREEVSICLQSQHYYSWGRGRKKWQEQCPIPTKWKWAAKTEEYCYPF